MLAGGVNSGCLLCGGFCCAHSLGFYGWHLWLSLTSCLPFSPVTLHKPQIIQVRDEYLVLSGAYFIWRRKWQPTPVFLPRESYGQRSLAGYSPRGRKSLNHHKSNNRKGLNNRKTKPAPSPPRGHIHL